MRLTGFKHSSDGVRPHTLGHMAATIKCPGPKAEASENCLLKYQLLQFVPFRGQHLCILATGLMAGRIKGEPIALLQLGEQGKQLVPLVGI